MQLFVVKLWDICLQIIAIWKGDDEISSIPFFRPKPSKIVIEWRTLGELTIKSMEDMRKRVPSFYKLT